MLDHPDSKGIIDFFYKKTDNFIHIDIKSLEIPNIDSIKGDLKNKIKLKYKDDHATILHDILSMRTYLTFNNIHKNIFNHIENYCKLDEQTSLIEMGQKDLEIYIQLMIKNLSIYLGNLAL